MPPARPLFIVGVERSGAGLIARLVGRSLPTGRGGDPAAYAAFSGDLIAARGDRWSPGLPERLAELAADPAWRDRARELIDPVASADGPWLWPYPETGLLLPFWAQLVADPICIVAGRNPYDASRSFLENRFPEKLKRIIQFPAYFSFRWQFTTLVQLSSCAAWSDTLFVGYELMMRSPVEQVRRLVRFLDSATGVSHGDDAVWTLLEDIDPSSWHFRDEHAFFELGSITKEQKQLFRYLQRRAGDAAEPFAPEHFPMPPYAWEYLRNFDLFVEQAVGESV